MENWKGTTGEVYSQLTRVILSDGSKNGMVISETLNQVARKRRENANLFADALNTVNKCDLMPSELLKQRDELLEALKKVTKLYVDLADCGDCGNWNPHEEEPISNAEQLIKQIEG